jgi:tRNA-dihydrouridine synthase B
MVEFYGERGIMMFRKHLHTYSKGMEEASSFRDKINRIIEIDEFRGEVRDFFSF